MRRKSEDPKSPRFRPKEEKRVQCGEEEVRRPRKTQVEQKRRKKVKQDADHISRKRVLPREEGGELQKQDSVLD